MPYRIDVPMVTDAEGTHPDVPAAWEWSSLGSGFATPRIVCFEDDRVIETWANARPDVSLVRAPPQMIPLRNAKGSDPPVTVERKRPDGTTRQKLQPPHPSKRNGAHAQYLSLLNGLAVEGDVPRGRGPNARSLIPLILTLGVAGAAQYLSLRHGGDWLPTLAIIIGSDAFTAANGTELDARSLDTGGAWNIGRGTGIWDIQGNEANLVTSKANNLPEGNDDGGSAVGDQYAEVTKAGTTRSGPCVRVQSGGATGYTAWTDGAATRIYADSTNIASGTGGAAALIRLEAVSSDFEMFVGGVSEVTALGDTTYATGWGGIFARDTGTASRLDDFEWGDFATATVEGAISPLPGFLGLMGLVATAAGSFFRNSYGTRRGTRLVRN